MKYVAVSLTRGMFYMTGPVYSAAFVAFLLSVIICPIFIRYFRRRRYGQQKRKDGPRGHFYKAGTPTMGGIVFLLSLFITTFFFAPKTLLLMLTLFMIFSSAFLGFIDDYQKVVQRRSLGLRAREKLLGQFILHWFFLLFCSCRAIPLWLTSPLPLSRLILVFFTPY